MTCCLHLLLPSPARERLFPWALQFLHIASLLPSTPPGLLLRRRIRLRWQLFRLLRDVRHLLLLSRRLIFGCVALELLDALSKGLADFRQLARTKNHQGNQENNSQTLHTNHFNFLQTLLSLIVI